MYALNPHRSKCEVEVELTLTNEMSFQGSLYLSHEQRILEALNDERKFVPFKTTAGDILTINKSMIACVQLIDQTMGCAKPIPLKVGIR